MNFVSQKPQPLEEDTLSNTAPDGFLVGTKIPQDFTHQLIHFIDTQNKYSWIENKKITRHTINFGWDYVKLDHNIQQYVDIPDILKKLRSQLVDIFKQDFNEPACAEDFDNIIVTIYEKGQFLIPHYDADMSKNPLTKRNFHFKEPILGVVLEADQDASFTFYYNDQNIRPKIDDPCIYKLKEENGSTFLIQGASRHRPYFHAIPPVKSRRISITMRRTVLPKT